MPADSFSRRLLKQMLVPLVPEKFYRYPQAIAKAWDIRTRSWWEPELELIPYVVGEGDTVIDIGANFGLYAYHLSKAVGKEGLVYAFEPVPYTAKTLRTVAKLLRMGERVHLLQEGCGERAEKTKFSVPVTSVGSLSAGLAHFSQRNNDRSGKEIHCRYPSKIDVECDVVVIDEILPDLERVTLIKCDIEGADLFALRGARKTIQKNLPVIICEINPWFMDGYGLKVEELVCDFLGNMGYQVYQYSDGKLSEFSSSEIVEDNWVFVHPKNRYRLNSLLSS